MKSWILPAGAAGGPELLRMEERDVPLPGPGQVRVRMRAWSLNYRDLAVAAGVYGSPVARDTVPLSDGAGEIVALGEGVLRWAVGDRVAANFFQAWRAGPFRAGVTGSDLGGPIDGVLAEEVVLDADGLVSLPDGLSFEEGACLPCAGVTAWHALAEVADIGPGTTVLLLGTGGVSIFSLQFAKAFGATVIVTSSSDEKLARTRALGADMTVNYRTEPDWDERVLALTDGRGADVVVEVGGPGTLARSLAAVSPGGTVCLIGVLSDPGMTISPLPLISKNVRLQGIYVGSNRIFEAMNAAIAAHGLHPVIDRSFPFADAPAAYAYQASGAHFGKVVITAAGQ